MKKWILILLITLSSQSQARWFTSKEIVEVGTTDLILPIIKVVDGDTINTYLSLPAPLNKVSIRIQHIDTPESTWRAKCDAEKHLGKMATKFLVNFIGDTAIMKIVNYKWDKFGSRIDGDIYINDVNIGQLMIDNGFARKYEGEKKSDWCQVIFDDL